MCKLEKVVAPFAEERTHILRKRVPKGESGEDEEGIDEFDTVWKEGMYA